MSVSVALLACWDMFLIPRMLQEQLQTVEQLTDHVAIGNLNCELRFIPNPVRGRVGMDHCTRGRPYGSFCNAGSFWFIPTTCTVRVAASSHCTCMLQNVAQRIMDIMKPWTQD
ncbi:Olfactory Receptor 10X1 [Manis pentadactyla]|nr:Olfactory Receptor 10X1 [Manis pentadactyla]